MLIQKKYESSDNQNSGNRHSVKIFNFTNKLLQYLMIYRKFMCNTMTVNGSFQVDGKTNAKIQSVFLEKFPIFNAQFSTDGREVIMGGKFPSFFCYDMIVGKIVRVPKLAGKDALSCSFY